MANFLGLVSSAIAVFTGATSSSNGTTGLVPAPTAGQEGYVLSGAATWIPMGGGGGGLTYTPITSSQTASINTIYGVNSNSLVVLTLPTVAPAGSIISVVGIGSGGWRIAQPSGVRINIGNQSTTTGSSGTVSSTNRYDSVQLICISANTTWTLLGGATGNFEIV